MNTADGTDHRRPQSLGDGLAAGSPITRIEARIETVGDDMRVRRALPSR